MKFGMDLGSDMSMEQQVRAVFQIGVSPVAEIVVSRPSAWQKFKRRWRGFILWLKNHLARLQ